MEVSILIVTKDRAVQLENTLNIIEELIDKAIHEIRIFIDGSSIPYAKLINKFSFVNWSSDETSYGASRARSILYPSARGEIIIGFDDDAHPLQKDFISRTEKLFKENPEVGILAYKEYKGLIYPDQDSVIRDVENKDYFTNDFLGCGFAIKKEVYKHTRGFPEWVDIYGEELCLSIEVLNLNKRILFTHKVSVHHRVDKEERFSSGQNYFRFAKQLKNTAAFYFVYYPFPKLLYKIGRLFAHNFLKYGISDLRYFFSFWKSTFEFLKDLYVLRQYRCPLTEEIISEFNLLKEPKYY